MVGQLKDNYRNIRNVMSITLAELASDQRSKKHDSMILAVWVD